MWTKTNTTEQLIKGIVKYGPDILENCICNDDLTVYKNRISQEFLDYTLPKTDIDHSNWFVPQKYKDMNIIDFVLSKTQNEEQYQRAVIELTEFENRNLFPLLKQMVYIIDTLRQHNIVWGVGRGSSVASYVLHLLGVHKIDSIKYNIPLNEFFKEEPKT